MQSFITRLFSHTENEKKKTSLTFDRASAALGSESKQNSTPNQQNNPSEYRYFFWIGSCQGFRQRWQEALVHKPESQLLPDFTDGVKRKKKQAKSNKVNKTISVQNSERVKTRTKSEKWKRVKQQKGMERLQKRNTEHRWTQPDNKPVTDQTRKTKQTLACAIKASVVVLILGIGE